MKNTVIHHSADYDGMFSREIARKFLPPDTEFIGWDFPDKPICLEGFYGTLYVLDLPCDKPFGFDFGKKLVYDSVTPESEPRIKKEWTAQMSILNLIASNRLLWIDHHKTSIDTHPPEIGGYRIDGVAACRLAWQWFCLKDKSWKEGDGATPPNPNKGFYVLPKKDDFVNREVCEPLAVRLAGEYDIGDKRDWRAELFQYGLDTEIDSNPDMFNWLLDQVATDENPYVQQLVAQGQCAATCINKRDADMMKSRSFIVQFEGLNFLALNIARCNSLTFAALDKPDTGHEALMGFCWNGKTWTVSLYHAKHNTTINLSLIAVKYGGGGHRGACGFTVGNLPGISNLPFISA